MLFVHSTALFFNFFHPLLPTITLKDLTWFAEEEQRHLTVTRLKAVQQKSDHVTHKVKGGRWCSKLPVLFFMV